VTFITDIHSDHTFFKLNIHIQHSAILEGKILMYRDIQHSTFSSIFIMSTFNIQHSPAFELKKGIVDIHNSTFSAKKKKTPTPDRSGPGYTRHNA
jgi:hypothetical protein